MADTKNQPLVQYQGALTGTLDEAESLGNLGLPYSPIQSMWQVNPGAEAVPSDKDEEMPNQTE